jgi:hypothetical protein
MIYNAKRVFLAVKASIRWLNTVLVPGFLASFWPRGFGTLFRNWPLLHIVQSLRQRRWKTTNTAPTTLIAIQAASQSTFSNEQLSTTCD